MANSLISAGGTEAAPAASVAKPIAAAGVETMVYRQLKGEPDLYLTHKDSDGVVFEYQIIDLKPGGAVPAGWSMTPVATAPDAPKAPLKLPAKGAP